MGDAAYLIDTAIKKNRCVALYLTLSKSNAKKLIWPELKLINDTFHLGAEVNEGDLSMKFGDSFVYASGAATKSDIERFRGLPLGLCIIDEVQSFPRFIRELIDDVVSKRLFDFNGTLALTGTPGPVPGGYFFDACNNPAYAHFYWTMFDNPWIEKKSGKKALQLLQEELDRKGITIDDPTIQREVFGRWVLDTKKLVIEYNESKNHYDALPRGTLKYIIGIDIGFEDADAIAVLGFSDSSPTTYLVDELITPKQGLTELCEQVERLRKQYDAHKLMIDQGGLGLKLAEEMRRRFKIPVVGADKKRKFETIEMLNDCLRTSRFMAKKDSRFVSDTMLMEWDFDKTTPEKKVVSDRFHSDIIDAVLYGFKESPAYAWEPPVIKPVKGTPEWAKEEEEEMFEQALEHAKQMEQVDESLEWL